MVDAGSITVSRVVLALVSTCKTLASDSTLSEERCVAVIKELLLLMSVFLCGFTKDAYECIAETVAIPAVCSHYMNQMRKTSDEVAMSRVAVFNSQTPQLNHVTPMRLMTGDRPQELPELLTDMILSSNLPHVVPAVHCDRLEKMLGEVLSVTVNAGP